MTTLYQNDCLHIVLPAPRSEKGKHVLAASIIPPFAYFKISYM